MRVAVYTDFPYHRSAAGLFAEQAFALFVAELAPRVERLVLVGRLDPSPASARHPLPESVGFEPLPHYASLSNPVASAAGMLRSLSRFWRVAGAVDVVWLLGPHPLSIAFAVLARLRRRTVVLGVRQDLPAYMAMRHPGRRALGLAGRLLERAYRLLARRLPTVVVGPALSRNYAHARRLLVITVSLVRREQLARAAGAPGRDYGGTLELLSVGRLDAEKNPLMLADLLAELARISDADWRLVVCGDGPLREPLAARLASLGLADAADLRGYVPVEAGMTALYERTHFLVLTSWTEGFPQVMVEAFAAGVPVVATDVGGIRAEAGGAVELSPPGDAAAMAAAVARLAGDAERRRSLTSAGLTYAAAHTVEDEIGRLVAFLASVR